MLCANPTPAQTWMRTLLLGQDNYALPNDSPVGILPPGFKGRVDAVCTNRSLSHEQVQAVRHYFTHKVTIVRGPTGKSAVIDGILEIEGELGQAVWVCTSAMIFERFAPHALVIKEASQIFDARAVFMILEAMSMGRLQRVLLIGEDKRVALRASRNPFHNTGVVSLLERLVKTGLTPVDLTSA